MFYRLSTLLPLQTQQNQKAQEDLRVENAGAPGRRW